VNHRANNEAPADDDVVIARIVKARGIKGEVACDLETDFPERFDTLDQVTVKMGDGERLRLAVEWHWFHNGRVILKFEGYDTMTAAQGLVGGLLVIPESERLPLERGEYYEYEIVGSEVIGPEGRRLGRVTGLMRTGGTDLLVVEGEQKREHLIPFADDICIDVDLKGKRIVVSPPEGLLEL
jgi:16S rRNA processing protein RimM